MSAEVLNEISQEVCDLCLKNKYSEAYAKAELAYIEFSSYNEWFCDNFWYKNGYIIRKQTVESLPEEQKINIEGVVVRKRKTKRPNQIPIAEQKIFFPLVLIDRFAISSFYVGNYHRSYYLCYKLLKTNFCDNIENLNNVKNNLSYCIDKIKERLNFFPEDIIHDYIFSNRKDLEEQKINVYIEESPKIHLCINSLINAFKDLSRIKFPIFILTEKEEIEGEKIENVQFSNDYNFVRFISSHQTKEYPHVFIRKNTSFFCRRNYINTPLNVFHENENLGCFLFNQFDGLSSDLRKSTIKKYHITKKQKKYLILEKKLEELPSGIYFQESHQNLKKACFVSNHYTYMDESIDYK